MVIFKREIKKLSIEERQASIRKKGQSYYRKILAKNFQSIGSPQSFFMFHNFNWGVDPEYSQDLSSNNSDTTVTNIWDKIHIHMGIYF